MLKSRSHCSHTHTDELTYSIATAYRIGPALCQTTNLRTVPTKNPRSDGKPEPNITTQVPLHQIFVKTYLRRLPQVRPWIREWPGWTSQKCPVYHENSNAELNRAMYGHAWHTLLPESKKAKTTYSKDTAFCQ